MKGLKKERVYDIPPSAIASSPIKLKRPEKGDRGSGKEKISHNMR